MLVPKKILAKRVCVLDLYYDEETDHIKVNLDLPGNPNPSDAEKRRLVKLLERAVAKVSDSVPPR